MLRWIVWPILTLFAIVVSAAAILAVLAHHTAIATIAPPLRSSFNPTAVERGRELTAVGHCAACHTKEGGQPYAGGRPIDTPLGVIYAPNITPDASTGIGRWSLAAFTRAMRSGVSRSGQQLYPAFPYNHFTHLHQSDIAALYAYFMTRTPVRARTPPNRLAFPFNIRAVVAGWNFLFLHPGPVKAKSDESAEWNHGEYLVKALADCGGCHTPRNWLQAEDTRDALAGGEGEGWYAPALNGQSPAPVRWTLAQLQTYLSTGFDRSHGAAAGPMRQVTVPLADVPPAYVHAIAVYVESLLPKAASSPTVEPRRSSSPEDLQAARIYDGACAICHSAHAEGALGSGPPWTNSTVLAEPSPQDFALIVLHGISGRSAYRAPFMPAFRDTLTNEQIAALAHYLRQRALGLPPWPGLLSTIRRARRQTVGAVP